MKDTTKTSTEFIEEITILKKRIQQLEQLESNRNKAETKKDKFQMLVEGISDVIFEIDHQGVILYLSPTLKDIWGYDEEDVLGMNFIELVHPDDREILIRRFVELSGGVEKPLSYRLKNKAGEFKWVRTKTKPRIENGIFVGANGTLIDITEQKQVEEALRDSELRMKEAQKIAHIGDWEWDISTNQLYWSDELYRIYGYEPQELNPVYELVLQAMLPRSKELFLDAIDAALKWDKAFDMEYDFSRKDGFISSLHTVGRVIRHKDGTPFRMRGIVQDITARKLAEKELKLSEEKYKDIFNTTVEGIYRSTPEGRLLILNPAFARICGYSSPEEMIEKVTDVGKQLYANMEDRVRFQNLIAKEKTVKGLEVQFKHPQKGLIWLSLHAKGIADEKGNISYYDGTIEDITDRKQAEADKEKIEVQERQLQKAESLSRMAAAIAHYFNNQLGVVIGSLEMTIDDLPQGAALLNNLTAAMQAAGKAAEMSGLMLTYLGQAPGKRKTIDLSETCRKSLSILRTAMPSKVILEQHLPVRGPFIKADANQIQQILTNLITNAWEAIGDGRGAIQLSVKTVLPEDISTLHIHHHIDWKPQNTAYACIEVADGGVGIPENVMDKLFDPFFSSKFTGRGMGLAVVMGIVRAHDGVVTVESKPERGSTFRAFFPEFEEGLTEQQDRDDNHADNLIIDAFAKGMEGGNAVLLVEDEEMVRNMVSVMLNRLGFSVLEAKDGVDALAVFRQHRDEICCVLCDLTMPRMNGWETLAAIRKLAPKVPAILASGYDKSQVMTGDHSEWPQAFLGKPYKLKGLRNAISKALSDNIKSE